MSPSNSASAAPEHDLETTAELPVLDAAAYEAAEARASATDSWLIPSTIEPEPEPEPQPEVLPLTADTKAERLADAEKDLRRAHARIAELKRELEARAAASVAVRDMRRDLAAAQALATTYMEALRSTEGRRGFFQELYTSLHWEIESGVDRVSDLEGQLAALGMRAKELESRVSGRDTRIAGLEKQLAELERMQAEKAALTSNVSSLAEKYTAAIARIAELETASSTAQTHREELDAVNAQNRKRIEQLEGELVTVRTELQQRAAALEGAATARGEHMARIAAGDAQIEELQNRIQEQQEFVRVLQADSNASVARVKELEGDLRAAEDMIHRLEADLRSRSARLDELEKTNQEWRTTVEEARNALTDRDSLIRRLEEETANSAVLLGAIQQRLDASGVHEIAPDGDKRLLIRTDGDSEVVHVLGRKTSVGRTPDNDLQIDAKFISRHHAVILAGPAHTIIEDLNSTNGVLVNGRRITRQPLKDGDAVVIGKTMFRFAVRPSAAERRA